jgi:23S rRNA-/tRNA-specific pseudouridylate synthase
MTPEEMLARLLYRDGLMLVIDKPAGFAVHRGPKGGESLEDYFDALRFGLPRNPALAHRLDKDTSGCLVLGRHRKALALIGKLFKQGKIGKTYWAVVEGAPEADDVEGDGARRRPELARARAADRADASAPRALRGDGLADPRRQYLRPRAAPRRAAAPFAFARDCGADFQEQAGGDDHRAGAGTHT